MDLIQLKLGNIRSNCYIVIEDDKCFIVDPGFESELVEEHINKAGVKPQFIYITHGHFDHTGGSNQLKKLYNIPVYAPELDKIWLNDSVYNRWEEPVIVDHYVNDNDEINFNNKILKVISTPGHSKGGTMLLYDGVLFGGDTIFYQSVGRTDLPFASFEELKSSIIKIYKSFPDNTIIYPGHGKPTTVGHEKMFNPFVSAKDLTS